MIDFDRLALERQHHNQKWMLGECRQKDHSLCSGNCRECDSRVLSPCEIEISDPFAFFMPIGAAYLFDGTDVPYTAYWDAMDYRDCAKNIGCEVI
jgi:hypothetical protein